MGFEARPHAEKGRHPVVTGLAASPSTECELMGLARSTSYDAASAPTTAADDIAFGSARSATSSSAKLTDMGPYG